ncbi:MAG: hypothetical protein K5896_08205 [Prevotella sp.]|nr:hypothetical protein [Prevotella sp.]
MAKSKYFEAKEAEEVYFVSNNERTLPSKDKILEEIEKCIPSEYDIISHRAIYNRLLMEKYTIHYNVDQVDSNRYRITVYYDMSLGILAIALWIVGLVVGGSVGYHFFKEIGAIVGAIAGVILVEAAIAKYKEVEQVCDRIVRGIKEYERAHLMSVSTR